MMFLKRLKAKKSSVVICPCCGVKTPVEKWNELAKSTYGENTPDVREAAQSKKNTFPFQCPSCYKGFSAYLLHFE